MPAKAFGNGFGGGFGGPASVGTLVVFVSADAGRPATAYQDGDVVCALNRRRTRAVHAEHLCHVRNFAPNADGLRDRGTIAEDWFAFTHRYRFERSADSVVRTDLMSLTQDVIGPAPNAAGEYIDVGVFLSRRKAFPNHRIFGAAGAEVWYGGQSGFSHAALDRVWAAIEQKTANREADFALWPAGGDELKQFLLIHVDDFDDAEAVSLTATVKDQAGALLKRRGRSVAWRSLRGMTAQRIADVLEPAAAVDVRAELKHVRSQIVAVKP